MSLLNNIKKNCPSTTTFIKRNENVEEKLLKTFPQSPTHGKRWL